MVERGGRSGRGRDVEEGVRERGGRDVDGSGASEMVISGEQRFSVLGGISSWKGADSVDRRGSCLSCG